MNTISPAHCIHLPNHWRKPGKPGPEWNTMEITLDGPHTIVYVNGEKVTDYTEGDPVPERKFDFEPYHGIKTQLRLYRFAKSRG